MASPRAVIVLIPAFNEEDTLAAVVHRIAELRPEAEIVAGYYGRCAQENRFHQEDRELGLDRIFSYHLPGQQLATLVGLFVWNFYICRGMELAAPPQELPDQETASDAPVLDGPPPLQSRDSKSEVLEPPETASTEAEPSNTLEEGAPDFRSEEHTSELQSH